MNSKPLVSVILPNYNHALFLPERIESILSQTYSNLELIILDDCSSDESVSVIGKYKDNPKISHIKINKENSGSTFIQWNYGFRIAKGEIIWIAESDDFCDPDLLENLVFNYCNNPGCVVAFCSSQYVNEKSETLGSYKFASYLFKIYDGKEFIKKRLIYGCAIWNASSAIFSRSVALKINADYMDYKACGDKLFWNLISEHGKVFHLNECKNYFRQHQNKVSPKKFRDGTSLKEEKAIYDWQIRKGYLKGLKKLYVKHLFLKKILNNEFSAIEIKNKLLNIWGYNKRLFKWEELLSNMYLYYYLRVFKQNPV